MNKILGSRIGRQPNAIKYYCVREITKLVSKGQAIQKRPRYSSPDPNEQKNTMLICSSVGRRVDVDGNGVCSVADRNNSDKPEGYWSRASTFSSTSSASSGNSQYHLPKALLPKKDVIGSISPPNTTAVMPLDIGLGNTDNVDGFSTTGSTVSNSFSPYFYLQQSATSPLIA